MPKPVELRVVDMHTAGEPVRIAETGYPELAGLTILEKRRSALTEHDHLRSMLMLEPRGHSGMYGVIPVTPSDPQADLAVLFTHKDGYSTMCGHATIAIGRWAVDTGKVPVSDGNAGFNLETPCGIIRVRVQDTHGPAPTIQFESVDAFVAEGDASLSVAGLGKVRVDLVFGGAFYAILRASEIGLSLAETSLDELVETAVRVCEAGRSQLRIDHPNEPELEFLYGVILTDDAALEGDRPEPSGNLCVFADGQVDRSPTGSGVTARLALAAHRRKLRVGTVCRIYGPSGVAFEASLASIRDHDDRRFSRVLVSGRAYYSARTTFVAEPGDPFTSGFVLPRRFADLQVP